RHHAVVDNVRVDDALAHRPGDLEMKHQEGDEVEECRPDHGSARRQHSRRDHGRDRVGRVVKAIEEIEQERQSDQEPDHQGQNRPWHRPEVLAGALEKMHGQLPLMTISEMTIATSLQASTVSSSQPYSSRSLIRSSRSGGLAKSWLSVLR